MRRPKVDKGGADEIRRCKNKANSRGDLVKRRCFTPPIKK